MLVCTPGGTPLRHSGRLGRGMPDPLAGEAAAIAEEAQLAAAGVAVHDFAAKSDWDLNGDRWFHAASTIKVAVLVAVAAAAADGRFQLGSRLAVRNRFL